jgi:chromosome segregation ATPase
MTKRAPKPPPDPVEELNTLVLEQNARINTQVKTIEGLEFAMCGNPDTGDEIGILGELTNAEDSVEELQTEITKMTERLKAQVKARDALRTRRDNTQTELDAARGKLGSLKEELKSILRKALSATVRT